MEGQLETLNHLLVETFNDILKVEEDSLCIAAGGSVTVTEVHTLDAVGMEGPRTVSALAAAMMVTVSTMTIAINRLEKKGLVERVRESSDRRVVRVRLTERGRGLSELHREFHARMVSAVVNHLNEDEVGALCRGMENLKGFFRDESRRNQEFLDDLKKEAEVGR